MLLVVLCTVGSLHDADASTGFDNSPAASTQRAAEAAPRLTVVVHRGGGRVAAGDYDNAKRWVSHTVQTTGRSEVTMPAFEGTDVEWRTMLSCARSHYSGLPIDFVEMPPPTGDYLLVVVGGTPRHLGQTNMWGLASMGLKAVVPKAVGFVFSAAVRVKDRTVALCETLTHEVGHMIGLDHSPDCSDVMSDNVECKNAFDKPGKRRFFRQPNRSALTSSLAAWTRGSKKPATRMADDANDETRALAAPKQKQKRPRSAK